MERIIGIGGVFFRASDPVGLAAWYREHLGIPVEAGNPWGVITSQAEGEHTVWATFPQDTDYFGDTGKAFMVNYRVRDLDAMLKQLRQAGVKVDEQAYEDENGWFGWGYDPEGNRFELWQPREK